MNIADDRSRAFAQTLFRSRGFAASASLAVVQQLFSGASVYALGRAAWVFAENHSLPELELALFFILASAAYLTGAWCIYYRQELANGLFDNLRNGLNSKVAKSIDELSQSDLDKYNTWVSGEVLPTTEDAAYFTVEFLTAILHVSISLIAIALIVSPYYSALLASCFLASFVVVSSFGAKIADLATRIQDCKNFALVTLDEEVNALAQCGPEAVPGTTFDKTQFKVSQERFRVFYEHNLRYKALEQVFATMPVCICIAIVYLVFVWSDSNVEGQASSFIATLPRVVAILSSMYAVTAYMSYYTLMKNKLWNLSRFVHSLARGEGVAT